MNVRADTENVDICAASQPLPKRPRRMKSANHAVYSIVKGHLECIASGDVGPLVMWKVKPAGCPYALHVCSYCAGTSAVQGLHVCNNNFCSHSILLLNQL